jgi:hypothetical protein
MQALRLSQQEALNVKAEVVVPNESLEVCRTDSEESILFLYMHPNILPGSAEGISNSGGACCSSPRQGAGGPRVCHRYVARP